MKYKIVSNGVNKKGLFLVLTTAIISGFSIFVSKYGVSVINPYIFTFLKNVSVALILSALILAFKNRKIFLKLTPKQWLLLLMIGLIGGCIPFLLFFKGLSLTTAAQGSFIQKTMFIYIIILASLFLKEKINKNFLIGVLLLLFGSFVALKALPISFGLGDLLILLATILWAIENVISKYALKKLEGITVAWGRMFFGSIFILIFLSITHQVNIISTLNYHQIGWVIATSLLLFGYVATWYSGLKYIPVSIASSILLLGSPVTTLLSLVATGKINLKELISGIIILAGLILIIDLKNFLKQIKQSYVRI